MPLPTLNATTMPFADGLLFDLAAPDPAKIRWPMLGLSLARIPRFNGHAERRYSVAEHSLRCWWLARELLTAPEIRLALLLHDAHEALMGDISRPARLLIERGPAGGAVKRLELELQACVAAAAGIPAERLDGLLVQLIDDAVLEVEGRALFSVAFTTRHRDLPAYQTILAVAQDPGTSRAWDALGWNLLTDRSLAEVWANEVLRALRAAAPDSSVRQALSSVGEHATCPEEC